MKGDVTVQSVQKKKWKGTKEKIWMRILVTANHYHNFIGG